MNRRYNGFPLDRVKITSGEFRRRQLLVRHYILHFDLDRLMHTFRMNAGIVETGKVQPLGGWEASDCGLRGHFVGHFLSAAAKFYAGCDNNDEPEVKRQLQSIVEQIIAVMEECAQPNGYLSAFPESEIDRLESKEYRKVWAPYYTLHKIMQGLNDAYRYVNNDTALKLSVNLAHYINGRFAKLGAWKIDNMLRPTRLNPLNEFGGIGDALYDLYDLTSDAVVLDTAKIFDRDYFMAPVAAGQDVLEDLHANTHLPQIIAAEHRYDITGEARYREAAVNFADMLEERTFANGSNSSKATHYTLEYGVSDKAEHWGTAGDLHDALTFGESESCNGHNTERIMSRLFEWTGDRRYLDWVARLKFNAVLNALSPRNGLSQYHQPMGVGARKIYSTPLDTFWCCTGTGVEGAADLNKDIWFRAVGNHEGNNEESSAAIPTLALTAFIPSTLDWHEQGVTVELDTNYPDDLKAMIVVHTEGDAESTADDQSVRMRLLLRPDLVADVDAPAVRQPNGFVCVDREWHDGDRVIISIDPHWHTEALRGAEHRRAVLEGDVLMAVKGHEVNIADLPEAGEALENKASELHMLPLYAIGGDCEYSVYLNTDMEHPVSPVLFEPVAEGANDPQ